MDFQIRFVIKNLYSFLIIALLNIFCSFSQNQGNISGEIYDSKSQLPLLGANIVLDNTSIGAISNENGYFTIDNIPTKTYNITISYIGYQSQKVYNVIIKSKGNPALKIFLNESSEALDEVVITESPFKKTMESPLSINTFSAVEIESYPGANNDITKVVQSMPGLSPSIGGFRNDIIIRGGAPNETVYYLDGIEIPNINHFSTQGSAGGPRGMINIAFIQEVTLSTSAFGVEYDNPLSGVLSFEQKDGNSSQFSGNFRTGITESGITFEGPVFNKSEEDANTTMIFSLRKSYLQFLFKFIGVPIRPDYWDYQWKIHHKIDKYNSINFIGVGSIDDFSVEAPDDFDAEQQAKLEQVPIIKQNTTTAGISWKRKYKNQKGQLITALSTNKLKNNFSRYADNLNESGLLFRNDSHEWETKLRIKSVNYYKDWKLKWGGNFQLSNYFNNTQNLYTGINYNTEIEFYKYGFFANGSRSFFNNRLDFSIGFRMDEDTFSTGSSLLDNFSPRASLSYAISEDRKWRWNMSIGRYYKIPTYTMLGYQNNDGEYLNKNNKYTESKHYVTGIDYNMTNSSKISIEAFLKKYDNFPVSIVDQVSLANKGGGFEVLGNEEVSSTGKGKTYGLEASFQQKLTNNFYGIFSYTYFYSKFSGFTSEYLPSVWDSRHLVSFSNGYKLNNNWELSSRLRYSGKTPYAPFDLNASLMSYPEMVLDYSRLGEEKLDKFSQLDVRVDKKWNKENISISFYFEIMNILSQEISVPPEYGLARDSEGNIIAPISLVKVNINRFTPIPTFGFSLDF